jgi:oxalate decarboxylase/phosphoglucose isomerase-like protein (cupin superfamily)
MQQIKDKDGNIYAIILRKNEWKKGLDFLTADQMAIQVGTWNYDKGKILDNHMHKEYERKTMKTEEVTYVVKGRMKVKLFNNHLEYLDEFILEQGDLSIVSYGGHGYEILEDNTMILEAKNGPFISVDKDKIKFK